MSPVEAVLLTQAECALCDHAKSVLERTAGLYELSVSTVDLGSVEGAALAAGAGILFPPGLLLDGEAFSYGRLSARKLRRELERRGARR